MAHRNRLTNNSDETDIASLISGDTIFCIPYFQRPYKWSPERLKQLNQDILSLVDEESDFHFLGAVIVHGRRTNPDLAPDFRTPG
ncbi:MAG: GmrSD restriction endonuclease domain-containing protein [Pseudomonadota bacterium]